ncbi:hypothetical protein PMAYCL1PPCAC_01077, partial [Pristionchus mayeri]
FRKMDLFSRMQRIEFKAAELVEILKEQEFNYHRASKWMGDHTLFTIQVVVLYVVSIHLIKDFMRERVAFKLTLPIQIWNLAVALMSGVGAAAMTPEYISTWNNRGYDATVCSSREDFFSGTGGVAVFVLTLARLPEFIDTYFIVLRKRPLLFIHWYHHAFTLFISWYGYSNLLPCSRHAIYVNALIHTVMYSYYFLCSLKIQLPSLVARLITIAQIIQFCFIFYAVGHTTVIHYLMGKPCELHDESIVLTWIMDLSYLYLFVDFYLNKYNRKIAKEDEVRAFKRD